VLRYVIVVGKGVLAKRTVSVKEPTLVNAKMAKVVGVSRVSLFVKKAMQLILHAVVRKKIVNAESVKEKRVRAESVRGQSVPIMDLSSLVKVRVRQAVQLIVPVVVGLRIVLVDPVNAAKRPKRFLAAVKSTGTCWVGCLVQLLY